MNVLTIFSRWFTGMHPISGIIFEWDLKQYINCFKSHSKMIWILQISVIFDIHFVSIERTSSFSFIKLEFGDKHSACHRLFCTFAIYLCVERWLYLFCLYIFRDKLSLSLSLIYLKCKEILEIFLTRVLADSWMESWCNSCVYDLVGIHFVF